MNGDEIETEWLECVPWDGMEASLPAGGKLKGPFWAYELVYRWEVGDAESEEGFREVKPSEMTVDLKKKVIGAKMNETLIKKIEGTYGPNYLELKPADGEGTLSRQAWRDRFGTDGLVLLAIRQYRFSPPPVTIGGPDGIHGPNEAGAGGDKTEYVKIGGKVGIHGPSEATGRQNKT
jgi:hypothetical protein